MRTIVNEHEPGFAGAIVTRLCVDAQLTASPIMLLAFVTIAKVFRQFVGP